MTKITMPYFTQDLYESQRWLVKSIMFNKNLNSLLSPRVRFEKKPSLSDSQCRREYIYIDLSNLSLSIHNKAKKKPPGAHALQASRITVFKSKGSRAGSGLMAPLVQGTSARMGGLKGQREERWDPRLPAHLFSQHTGGEARKTAWHFCYHYCHHARIFIKEQTLWDMRRHGVMEKQMQHERVKEVDK